MIKQHARKCRRSIGGFLIYIMAAIYLVVLLMNAIQMGKYIKLLLIIFLIAIGLISYYIEVKKGTFNIVYLQAEYIEIKGLMCTSKIYWKDINNVRLVGEEYDIDNGLNERYYYIYHSDNDMNFKYMISYSKEVEQGLREFYYRKNIKED